MLNLGANAVNVSCDILLATYNGARWLPELLDSILSQDTSNYNLLVRDDGSSDATLQILDSYKEKFLGRMTIFPNSYSSGTAKGNFSLLMQHSNADYIFWADQDDIWYPNKISLLLNKMLLLENNRKEVPVYVFSNAKIINDKGQETGQSYWDFKKLKPYAGLSLPKSLICPSILGCTSAINKSLLELIVPVPEGVTGHDWWGHLVALSFGEVGFVDEFTIGYRIHSSNASQQKKVSLLSYLLKREKFEKVRRGMDLRMKQANCLLERFDNIPLEKRSLIKSFVELKGENFISRRVSIFKNNFTYPDFQRNLAVFVAF